jgi:hypothetical protein
MAQSSGSSPIPYQVREAMKQNARPVALNRSVIERGQAGGHAGGGVEKARTPGGGMGAFGGGGEARGGAAIGSGESNFQNGNFDRGPITTIFGMPTANEGALTTAGKQQQADFGAVQAFLGAYGAAKGRGASETDAMHYAVKYAGPDPVATLSAVMRHSGGTPLQSMENFRQFLAQGVPQGPQNVGLTKDGQVLQQDAQGNVTAKDIPGFRAPAAAGTTLNTKDLVPIVGPDGKTTWNAVTRGPDGKLTTTAVPAPGTLGPNGERNPGAGGSAGDNVIAGGGAGAGGAAVAPTKGGAATAGPLTKYSGDPIPTGGSGKHPLTQGEVSYLSNASNYISDLKVARDYANAAGPVSGAVQYVGGKYLGVNDQGAMYAAALNRLDQGVYAQYGIKGSAGAKQLMATLPTHSEASSYVKSSVTQMIAEAQSELQDRADLAEQRTQAPLPGTLRTQLEATTDVYPLSDQNNASPTWVARNYPDKLSGPQAVALSHRADLEPSETAGLNQSLDTQQSRRQADAVAAANAPLPKPATPDYAASPAPPKPQPGDMTAGGALPGVAGQGAGAAPSAPPADLGGANTAGKGPGAAADYAAETGQQPGTGVPAPLPGGASPNAPQRPLAGQGGPGQSNPAADQDFSEGGTPPAPPAVVTPTVPAPLSGQQSGSGGIGGNGGGLAISTPGSAATTPQAAAGAALAPSPSSTAPASPAATPGGTGINPYAAAVVDAMGSGT